MEMKPEDLRQSAAGQESLLQCQDAYAVMGQVFNILSDDYHSVFYANMDDGFIFPYRLSPEIKEKFGEFLNRHPSYMQMLKYYSDLRVRSQEREAFLRALHPDNVRKQTKDGKPFVYEYRNEQNGENHFIQVKIVRLPGEDACRIIGAFADVNPLRQHDLEYYYYTDRLTGGHNYAYFKENVLQRKATATEAGCIIAMDVHSFKTINTVCGVQKGDEVICAIWREMEACLASGDVAAHINADHFVIYAHTGKKEQITALLKRITTALGHISEVLETPSIEPYFGVALLSAEDEIENAYSQARLAKNKIRLRTGNNVAFFSQEDSARMLLEQDMETSFHQAMAEKRFEVWYQPKFNPVTEELVGAEALIRWRREDGTLVPPGEFIPLFERNGLIRLLDLFVFRTVSYQQKKWEAENRPLIPISVNLSRASLFYRDVVERYERIVRASHVDPKVVPLEITESAVVDNKAICELAHAFREAGFVLHMDDFGSGYSSLSQLNTVYFDTLKIDKSLVDYIGSYRGGRLLTHIITLAKELGLKVVAEGAEFKEQIKLLSEMSCDAVQGFFYSRPLPLAEFEKLYAEKIQAANKETPQVTNLLEFTDIRHLLLDERFSDGTLEDMMGILAFYTLDGDELEVTHVNKAYCRITGLDEKVRASYRKGIRELIPHEQYLTLVEAFRDAERFYPRSVHHAGIYKREDGEIINCALQIYFLRTWNGKKEYFARIECF